MRGVAAAQVPAARDLRVQRLRLPGQASGALAAHALLATAAGRGPMRGVAPGEHPTGPQSAPAAAPTSAAAASLARLAPAKAGQRAARAPWVAAAVAAGVPEEPAVHRGGECLGASEQCGEAGQRLAESI